ncbi:hydroxymethylglutaryl-CoA lyase, partial [Tremellales sp. Uapishka_1]
MADTTQLLPLLPSFSTSTPSTSNRSTSPFSGLPLGGPNQDPLPEHAGDIHYPVLVPNMKGLENLLRLQEGNAERLTDEIAIFVSATEAFSQANNDSSLAKILASLPPLIDRALSHGYRVRAYVSCVITCPYSGPTDPAQVAHVAEKLLQHGCYEVSLGDTTGEGTPESWRLVWEELRGRGVKVSQLAAHVRILVACTLGGMTDPVQCHDTFSMALSSLLSLLPLGLETIDTSLAGLGGCPYSPGATGNVPTEDVVYALHKLGYRTGIDLDKLVESGNWLSGELGVRNESRVGRAVWARRKKSEMEGKEGSL